MTEVDSLRSFVPGVDDETVEAWFAKRAWVHVPGDPATVREYFGWSQLNVLLAHSELSEPQLRLVGAGDTTDLHVWAMAGGQRAFSRIRAEALHREMAGGATLVLDQLDRLIPSIGLTARGVSGIAKSRVQANLYGSLVGAPGFGAHRDSHDVIVVQLEGSKQWTVGDPEREEQLLMHPGDVIYMPEGTRHDVSTPASGSLHVTFAIPLPRFGEYVAARSDRLLSAEADGIMRGQVDGLREVSSAVYLGEISDADAYLAAQVNDGLRGNFVNLPYAAGSRATEALEPVGLLRAPEDSHDLPPDSIGDQVVQALSPWEPMELTTLGRLLPGLPEHELLAAARSLISQGRIRVIEAARRR